MDIFYEKKNIHITAAALAIVGCVAMILFPQIALLSAQKGISLWAGSVLPALLPFFICANFLNYLGVTTMLSPAAFTFTMSVVSGYPMGAKIIGDLCRRGHLDAGEARRLITFCSTSGPTFMIGAVGVGMLGSVKAGAVIAIAHYLAAIINGLVFTYLRKGSSGRVKSGRERIHTFGFQKKGANTLDLLTEAMLAAFKSLGIILAYMVLFMFLTDLIQFSGLLNWVEPVLMKGFLKGFFEMTVGCSALSACYGEPLLWRTVLCCSLISFGGLSILGQSLSMLSGSGIRPLYFLGVKACHGLFAGILAFILFTLVV